MNRILEWTLNHKAIIAIFFALGAGLGLYSLASIPVDAVPDITSAQVVVNTKTKALDPEQIEKTVSFPIETEMSGIAKVKEVRSLSKYGLSQVVIVFEDGTDIYWARQQVAERLQKVQGDLAQGLSPELAPITTGLGEVLMYAVVADPSSELAKKWERDRLLYLRTIQDFVIAPYLKRSIKNVAEVDSTGGFKKEIHIEVHPERLDDYGLSIEQIAQRLEALGENIGGGYIQPQGKQVIVRASGRVNTLDEISTLPIKLDVQGRSVPLSKIADVREDYSQRVGGATYNGEETVMGTVLMLSGANSRQVALDAEQALKEVPLPAGVKLELLYSRSYLVNATLKTVAKSLVEGAALVIAVLLLILGNFRAALFVSLAIPLSMLFGLIGMRWMGVSASLMSLGAIDFGLLVDGAVVMIENSIRRLEEHKGELTPHARLAFILESAQEVVKPITLGLVIIMLVYVPILSLEGVEGKLYHPMAITVLAALAASLLVAVLLMPVLAYLFLRPPHGGGTEEKMVYRTFRKLYEPALNLSLRRPIFVLIPAAILVVCSLGPCP
jgi:cobalt-zinc-cadmium resistance protein CzcA